MSILKRRTVLAVIGVFVLTICCAVALPRGVSPATASLYSGTVFICRDGSKTIPIAKVNDNYCDCADGSDEPGLLVSHVSGWHLTRCRYIGVCGWSLLLCERGLQAAKFAVDVCE
jgi:hypothetical protein